MLSIKIAQNNIKEFMNALLKNEMFDDFEVRGVEVFSFTRFDISGVKIAPESEPPVTTDETGEPEKLEKAKYCLWSELKPYAFNIIKGNVKPKSIKIIFSLESDKAQNLHDNAAALYLNLFFSGNDVIFTTATAQRIFALDKSVDIVWQEYIEHFFTKNNFAYEHNQ